MLGKRSLFGAAASAMLAVAAAVAQEAPVSTAPAAAPAARPAQGESIAAIVNDEIISTYDLRQRLLLLIVQSGVQPTPEQLPAYQREALRNLIDERLQLQELRRQEQERNLQGKIVATDEEVAAEVARIAQGSNISVQQLDQVLIEAGVRPQTLRERLRAEISWQSWISNRYGRRVRVGQDQVAARVKAITEAASRPQFLISEIFIDAARVGGQDEAVAGAQQLISQIQQGAPFGAIARQFSSAASAAGGGDAGWLQENELEAQVRAAVDQMRPGQISQPIPAPEGVYIILLRDKRAGAGSTVVNLKQAAVQLTAEAPEAEVQAAQARLAALKTRITGCEGLEAQAATEPGVIAGDLGEADLKDLDGPFREAAARLQPGQVSDPIRTQVGLHLVAVCAKKTGGAQAPTPVQVENRLYSEQLAMVSRRSMRDLRNSATIESR